jgi:dynamin 1-like protein
MEFISHVANIIPWRETEDHTLLSKKILHITGLLHNSHIDPQMITLPRLVVVGTQSSGKSSLLNSIMGIDILPVGSTMTTRTPVTLELCPSNESRIEFGSYQDGNWMMDKKIVIQYPAMTLDQKETVRKEIEKQTITLAGNECNISAHCITLKLFAPSLPLLTMTDLPGLTSIAITDRGQPANMKDQLIQLVKTYTVSPSTLIMAILPARPDIEADMSMELLKQIDPKGERTIGILTKLDLMNEDTDIHCYLENKVSKDLSLTYGYYGVRNKMGATIAETIAAEKNYFRSHPTYQKPQYQSRLGVPQVASNLSTILLQSITQALPRVIDTLTHKEKEIHVEATRLGPSIPPNKEIRTTMIHGLLHPFVKQYIHAVEGRGSGKSTARAIHDTFTTFRSSVSDLQPFEHITETYLHDLYSNHDGLHMRFTSLPVEVLEHCLRDPSHRPIHKLVEPSRICLQTTVDVIRLLQTELIEQSPIQKYPQLSKCIKQIMGDINTSFYQSTLDSIQECIASEESYIWTDDPVFHKLVHVCHNAIDFKKILEVYYEKIVYRVRDTIPKRIVYHMTRMDEQLQSILTDKISHGDSISLLEESPDVEQRRVLLSKQKTEVTAILSKLKEIL